MSASEGSPGLDGLLTETRRAAADYAALSTLELVELMNREDASVSAAVAAEAEAIAMALDAIVARVRAGGRLVYACEGTFSTAAGQVVALVAGSEGASSAEREAAEDDSAAGRKAVEELGVTAGDVVVGVSASGRTPYVVAALEAAADAGALTVALTATRDSELAGIAEHELAVVVGPEVLSGSTRLKAGTAQKLVLNTISTVAMIRLGKTFGDLMVDVRASNEKLAARARRVVREAAGVSDEHAEAALAAAGGSAKIAVVALLAELDVDAARARLDAAGGDIQAALGR